MTKQPEKPTKQDPDAELREDRSRLRKFFDKGIDSVYRAGAVSRSHPIRRRLSIASALGGVLIPGPGSLAGELISAAIGPAVVNAAAQFIPDQHQNLTDDKPGPMNRYRTFARQQDVADKDGAAVADVAHFVATDMEMRRARANWTQLSLRERKAVMKAVHDRFVGNYPDVNQADIVFTYHAPMEDKEKKGPDGKPAKRIMGGAYVLADEAEIPRVAKLLVGSDFFKQRVMVNAHAAADKLFGGFDGMVDIIVHESTHHLQRVLGKKARDAMPVIQFSGDGVFGQRPRNENDPPAVPMHNAYSEDERRFWNSQYAGRHGATLRSVRQYMEQPIEGQAFSNGNIARALAHNFRNMDAARRNSLTADDVKKIGQKVMNGLEMQALWHDKHEKSIASYSHKGLAPGADYAIMGKPDSFMPITEAAINAVKPPVPPRPSAGAAHP